VGIIPPFLVGERRDYRRFGYVRFTRLGRVDSKGIP